jgi:hypothetical protein
MVLVHSAAHGEVSVGLVCDRSPAAPHPARGLDGFFRDALATSTLVGAMVSAGRLARGPIATTSHGYSSTRYAGPGWLLTGDAGSFVDPRGHWRCQRPTDGLLAAGVVEAVGDGRVAEADAVAHYDAQLAQRTDRTLALVRFVYGSNQLHGDEPFWRARRPPPIDVATASPAGILRSLSSDPSARYFRNAFRGMGHGADTLAPLDETLERWDHRDAAIGGLTLDLTAWAPRFRPAVTTRRSLGFERYRLTPASCSTTPASSISPTTPRWQPPSRPSTGDAPRGDRRRRGGRGAGRTVGDHAVTRDRRARRGLAGRPDRGRSQRCAARGSRVS